MKTLVWSSRFIRAVKRLMRQNPQLRHDIEQILQQLAEYPFNPKLRTHKLKGELSDVWSCSLDYSNRILFECVNNPETEEEEIVLLNLGSHDEVY